MKQFYPSRLFTTQSGLRKHILVFGVTVFILAVSASINSLYGQAVYVNKVDYMPGDVVNISGYAWLPGEVVNVVLTENFLNPGGKLITTKSFSCDSKGMFNGPLYNVVEANLGAFFKVTATGAISKHVCTTVFNDAGGDYSIDYSAYDPEFYARRIPSSFSAGFFPYEGNHVSPLGLGGANGYTMHTKTVESLNPQFLGLGQIIAFEFYLSVDASSACPNDKITFGGDWSTVTQNGGNFGYDPNYKVIAAFVDPSPETNYVDSGTPASARILTNTVNGTNIEATFEVSGLDPGDKFPVEIWLVLKNNINAGVGSNVPSGFVDGLTAGTCEAGSTVKSGNQTIPLLQASDFFTTDVDLSVTKTDSQDPVVIGTPFSYTLTIQNTGPSVANNITITDVLSSSNLVAGTPTYSNGSANWTLVQAGQTLTFTTLSIGIDETITITIPITWTGVYNGTKTIGSAGNGAAGSLCTGDLTNKVSVTTLSDDTNAANDSYCQPTNVTCSTITGNAGSDKNLTCLVTTATLDGTSNMQTATYSWIASNGGHISSGANTATPVVDAAGTYTLTVTDPANGCTATDVALVTLSNTLPNVNAGLDKQLTCAVTSVTLDGSSTLQTATFSWVASGGGHIVSGGTTATPVVDAAGTYTLTVTDPANGCTATDVALVTGLPDRVPPVITCPDPVTIKCTNEVPEPVIPQATDDCGIKEVKWVSDERTDQNCNNFSIKRTYTATDLSGNQASCTQIITVVNDVPLAPIKPTFSTIECSSKIGDYLLPRPPVVTDNCGNVIVPTGPVRSQVPQCEGKKTWTWTYTDCEGNKQEYVHTITVDKLPFPAITPTFSTIECVNKIGDYLVPPLPVVTDNCGNVLTPVGPVKSSLPVCSGTKTWTWTYTDCAGNTRDYVHTVTVSPKPFPEIKPATATFECQGEIKMPVMPIVKDNCGNILSPSGPVITPVGDCGGSKTYTWTYTDCAGNKRDFVFTALVKMTKPLAPIAPTFGTIGCVKDLWDGIVPKLPVVTDNCGNVLTPTGPVKSQKPDCEGTKTWTWTYMDCAGHTQQYVHTVTIKMTPFAEITPTFETVACVSDIKAPVPPVITDNCGNILNPVGPVKSSLPSCEGSKTFTWTYTDCAGNKRNYVHTVTVEYQPFAPIAPTTETFDKASDIVLPDLPVVTDNCGTVLNPVGPVVTPSNECQDEAVYTWTYTDCAGNSRDYVHTVKVKDCILLNHCTYTQGFYGNSNGTNCLLTGNGYVNTKALDMMKAAFGNLDYVLFGSLSTGKYFKLMSGSITGSTTPEGIFQLMPGGGTPDALVGAATSLDEMSLWGNVPRSVQQGTLGKIKNNLLSQTIALFFNIQNDGTLGNMRIAGRYMVTLKSTECGSQIPVANSGIYTEIPQSVLDYFDANGLTGTVNDLYDLANKVLGGEIINPVVSAGDVTMAVDAINVGFDECRILSEFTSEVPDVSKAISTSFDFGKKKDDFTYGEFREAILTVYPNPFATVVKFQLEMISDSHVRVEIYSHNGALLKVIFNEDLREGDIRTTEFDASMYAHSAFLYKVVTQSSILSGTIVKIK